MLVASRRLHILVQAFLLNILDVELGVVLEYLRKWLQDEHEDKKDSVAYDTSGWTDVVWTRGETPRQLGAADCGVFLVRTAEYLALDALLDFTQADMAVFRRRMVYEIQKGELLVS